MKLSSIVGAICIIFVLFFISSYDNHQSPHYVKLARRITANTAKKLEIGKALNLSGTGGAMMNDIQMMMMAFQFYQIVDIETARELLVYSVEEYLSAINSNEEIRPYLHNYPFTAENIQIEIYFRTPDHHNVPFGEINIAAASRGEIVYYTKSSPTSLLHLKYEETYHDALKAISSSKEERIEAE